MTTVTARSPGLHRDRIFYSGMTLAMAVLVGVGFSPSYYLRSPDFAGPPMTTLLHIHGAVATAWFVLLIAQTWLVAGRQIPVHRKLGWAAAAVAAALIVIGPMTVIQAVNRGGPMPPGLTPELLMMLALADIATFAPLVGAGVLFRHKAETHKRLMLLGSIALLDAAAARVPALAANPWYGFLAVDAFIAAGVLYDLATRRRVHPVWIWGGLLILTQPLRLWFATTPAWASFVAAITG